MVDESIVVRIREAVLAINATPDCQTTIALDLSPVETAKAFIDFCNKAMDDADIGNAVPQIVEDVWNEIPQAWIDDKNNIQVGVQPQPEPEPEPETKPEPMPEPQQRRKRGRPRKTDKTQDAKKPEETKKPEKHRKRKSKYAGTEHATKGDFRFMRDKIVSRNNKLKYGDLIPQTKTLYGHMPKTMSGIIDVAIREGIDMDDLINKLLNVIMEKEPDANRMLMRERAYKKMCAHLIYLPRHKGVQVIFFEYSTGTIIKTYANRPGSVALDSNILVKNRKLSKEEALQYLQARVKTDAVEDVLHHGSNVLLPSMELPYAVKKKSAEGTTETAPEQAEELEESDDIMQLLPCTELPNSVKAKKPQ